MQNRYFESIENLSLNEYVDLYPCLDALRFDDNGLIPVVTQCNFTGNVLMQAWMNKEAIFKTLASGNMVYWSRSRNSYWEKGQTSGHRQKLITMYFDCDGDALLCKVEQLGSSCHTYRASCFYLQVDRESEQVKCCLPKL